MLKFAKILVFSLFAAPQRLPCDYHVSRMREVIALIEPQKSNHDYWLAVSLLFCPTLPLPICFDHMQSPLMPNENCQLHLLQKVHANLTAP